jgi:imidazolonepropionase
MSDSTARRLWTHARIATMEGDDLGIVERGALVTNGSLIEWIGPAEALPTGMEFKVETDCAGALITPGLIDCHTHLVFAGNRAGEFEMRLNGATYEDISRAGGGILSTVRATRAASEDVLFVQSESRLDALMREGVTTVEIKSGYGLDLDTELKMLRVARELGEKHGLTVRTSFLGAHAVPAEYIGRIDEYVDVVCGEMLPAVAASGLADAVDAFCENIGFSNAQIRRVFEAARAHGLPLKLHAEQLSDSGGAQLATEFSALSADHLEYLNDSGVKAMADAGTVAVLLPGAFYFLRETRSPPIEMLRAHCVPIAVASDLNPGTSPIVSLLAIMQMAATLFRLTPVEVLRGVTCNAARALGLSASHGQLLSGKRADFCLWECESPAELVYWMGGIKPRQIVCGGKARRNG